MGKFLMAVMFGVGWLVASVGIVFLLKLIVPEKIALILGCICAMLLSLLIFKFRGFRRG